MAEHQNLPDVVIVGGSLTGLLHGIVLKNLGRNVLILEKATTDVRESQAAGIGCAGEICRLLDEANIERRDLGPFNTVNDCYTPLNNQAELQRAFQMPYESVVTAWTVLYHRLRANFDGFVSETCPQRVPDTMRSEKNRFGMAEYRTGCSVTAIEYDRSNEQVILTYDDLHTSTPSLQVRASLVIAADGGNSTIRKKLLPASLPRQYAGYSAWRGTFPLRNAPQASKDLIGSNLLMYGVKSEATYHVTYLIPPDNGSTNPDDLLVNFVWYDWLPENSQDYRNALTDSSGVQHRWTLPAGEMDPKVWQKQVDRAKSIMHPQVAALVEGIPEERAFVTAVSDSISPQVTFFDNHVILSGEALAVARPHTGRATDEAARQALLLGEVVSGKRSWASFTNEAWSATYLNLTKSRMVAAMFMAPKTTMIYAVLRLKLATWAYQARKLWCG